MEQLSEDFVFSCIQPRAQESHKGSYGHVLLAGGSRRYRGAANLAAEGALRSGAGIVTLAAIEPVIAAAAARLPECCLLPCPEGAGGGISAGAAAELLAAREKGGGTAGIDISKFAVRAAAGRYKGIDFAVASLFHIPCAAESADVLTDVFAPIVPAEFRHVLKPGGVMNLAVPGARHLYGMKEVLYTAPYENEERDTDYEGFAFLGSESVRREITVEGAENIEALFSMTPYYWKTDVAGGERLRRLDTLQTEIKFRFLVYRRL